MTGDLEVAIALWLGKAPQSRRVNFRALPLHGSPERVGLTWRCTVEVLDPAEAAWQAAYNELVARVL